MNESWSDQFDVVFKDMMIKRGEIDNATKKSTY